MYTSALLALQRNMVARRAELGLSQHALAELAGVNRAYVGQLELATRNPSLLILARIAAALETEITALFEARSKVASNERYSRKGRKPPRR